MSTIHFSYYNLSMQSSRRMNEITKISRGKSLSIFLLTKTFDLQTTGMTPLMYAVKDNRSALLDRMIELGADVGARNNASTS